VAWVYSVQAYFGSSKCDFFLKFLRTVAKEILRPNGCSTWLQPTILRDKVHSLPISGKKIASIIILLSQLHWISKVTGQTADRDLDCLAARVSCSR
jgi:hypothetical protein